MMNTPKIAIMMPVLNGLPLIKASIDSLLKQTYTNWECIIIDDGSKDGTSEFIDSINDYRFKIVHFDKNYGRPVARQKALDLAEGDYIAMLDAGDIYHPLKLQQQVEVFEKHTTVDLVSSKMCSFGTKTDQLYGRGSSYNGEVIFNGDNLPLHGPSMIRMSVAKQFAYNPKMKLGQDSDYMERLLVGRRFYVIPEYLYYYSELDSVNKKKIRKAYRLRISRYYNNGKWGKLSISIFKYLYSLLVFPFVSIDSILAKRGNIVTGSGKDEFDLIIKPIIEKYVK